MAEVDEREVLDGPALTDLYTWVDKVPLTRPKRNIARDFSDGVLLAEIVQHYLPRVVDIHNYVASHSSGQKKINWATLNRKVFSKLGMKLSDLMITQVVDAKPGAIEQILWELKKRISDNPNIGLIRSTVQLSGSNAALGARCGVPSTQTIFVDKVHATPSCVKIDPIKEPPKHSSNSRPYSSRSRSILPSRSRVPSARELNVQSATPSNHTKPLVTAVTPTPIAPRPSTINKCISACPSERGILINKNRTPSEVVLQLRPSEESTAGDTNQRSGSQYVSASSSEAYFPMNHIIYRGHKMIPVEALDSKEKEVDKLEKDNRTLQSKIDRLTALSELKEKRIKDLSEQLHNLRVMYERLTRS